MANYLTYLERQKRREEEQKARNLRDAKIYDARMSGMTLKAVGAMFGLLSRESVRRICDRRELETQWERWKYAEKHAIARQRSPLVWPLDDETPQVWDAESNARELGLI